MDVGDATDAAGRVLRRRPAELLPPFVAEAATGVVAQTVGLVAGTAALLSLRGTGRIERVNEAVAALTDGNPTETEVEGVVAAVEGLLTPTVTAVLAAGAVVGVVAVIVFRAAVGAAKLNAALAAVDETGQRAPAGGEERLTGDDDQRDGEANDEWNEGKTNEGRGHSDPLTAAVEGVFADTATVVGVTVLRAGVLLLPVVLLGGGGVATLIGLLLVVPAVLFAYLGFLFVGEAVVVDGAGAVGAVRRSIGFLGRETGRALTYVALELGAFASVAVLGGVFAAVGVGRLTSVVSLFVVLPWLGLVRMGLYLPDGPTPPSGQTARDRAAATATTPAPTVGSQKGERQTGVPSDEPAPAWDDDQDQGDTGDDEPDWHDPDRDGPVGDGPTGIAADAVSGLRTGVEALRRFLVTHPGLFVIALATFGVGAGVGRLVGPQVPEPITGDPGAVFGDVPVGTAINLAANNWLVAVAESYAGLAAGLPTLANLFFNGLVVGAASGLFEPVTFLALILPHGVVEVPALAAGGALGLHLAREGYGVVRDRTTTAAFADEVRRGFLVLVGLLPVFVVAGVIEAFLTPLVGRLVLGG